MAWEGGLVAQWHTLLLLYLRLTFLFPVTFCQAIIFMMRMTEARKAIKDCGIQQQTGFKGKTLYEKQKQRELSKKSQSSYVKGDEIEVEVVGWSEKEVPKASVGLANEGSTREEQNVHFIDPPKKFAEGTTGVDDPALLLSDVTQIFLFRSCLRFSTLPSLSISILLCFTDAN